MITSQRFLLAVGATIIGLGAVSSATAADDAVAKVTGAWQRRSIAIQRVRYRMSGTATYMQGSLCPPGHHEMPTENPSPVGYPEKDSSIPIGLVWLIDLPEDRFRKESKEMSFDLPLRRFVPRVHIQAFNGRESKGWFPREANVGEGYARRALDADIWIAKSDETWGYFDVVDMPVLFAHGLFALKPAHLRSADAGNLRGLTLVGQVETADGTQVVVSARKVTGSGGDTLETEDRYWVDLARDGAITRWESLISSLVYHRVNTRWKKHSSGHWLPERWECESFEDGSQGTTKLRSATRIQVENIDIDPPFVPDEFEIPLKEGMIVQQESDNSRFRVAADGRTLEALSWAAEYDPPPATSTGVGGRLWLAIACLAIGGAACWRYFARG